MINEDYQKYKHNIFSIILLITDLEANNIDEFKACEKIEKANIPLVCLDMLIQYAIDREYPHIYLLILKKKEELNGFTQKDKERFEL